MSLIPFAEASCTVGDTKSRCSRSWRGGEYSGWVYTRTNSICVKGSPNYWAIQSQISYDSSCWPADMSGGVKG